VNVGAAAYWIGIDLGTSSCKVVAITASGEVAASRSAEYPLITPRAGWAEQEPDAWWQATDVTVRGVMSELPKAASIRGIGLCGQMHGLTPMDGMGNVIRPAILWNDQRAAPQCEEITRRAGGEAALLRLVQNRMLPGFTGGKILWLRQHEPDNYNRLRHVLNPKDFLRLRMTGEYVTDVSDASGTGLFDVRHRQWSTTLLKMLEIPLDYMPRVVESSEVSGVLLDDVAHRWGMPVGTRVVGGGGDSVLQTTSMGIVEPGRLGVTIGTAGIVAGATNFCPDNPGGRLQISCGNAPGRWHVMGVSLTSGGAFQWLRNALAPIADMRGLSYERLVEVAREAPPGSGGLLFMPYLLGERCPHEAPDARGGWIGLNALHSVHHLSRSVVEGVLLSLREIVDLCADAGLEWDEIRASGGATAERFWTQTLADVLQQDIVLVTGASQGGAFGAALLAAVGTGNWRSLDDASSVIQETDRISPNPDLAALYEQLHQVHSRLLQTLMPSFLKIAAGPL